MAVAVLFRRRWPMWSMAAISLAALMQVILFPPAYDPLPYDLAVLVGMYSVVKYARPRIGPAGGGHGGDGHRDRDRSFSGVGPVPVGPVLRGRTAWRS
jgi:hypothetical protein